MSRNGNLAATHRFFTPVRIRVVLPRLAQFSCGRTGTQRSLETGIVNSRQYRQCNTRAGVDVVAAIRASCPRCSELGIKSPSPSRSSG